MSSFSKQSLQALRAMTAEQLAEEASKIEVRLLQLRLQLAARQLTNTAEFKQLRHQLAQISMLLTELKRKQA